MAKSRFVQKSLLHFVMAGNLKLNCELPDWFLDRLQQQVLLVVYFQNKYRTLVHTAVLDVAPLSISFMSKKIINF